MIGLSYIFHDCFLVETQGANLVFDYWKERVENRGELPGFLENIDREKPLYVFVSHHHKDHFVKDIFEWQKSFPGIHFILSYDTARFCRHILSPTSIYKGAKPAPERVTVMRPGDTFSDGLVEVAAFGSTDIGCSYAVVAGGERIFHAGDLNAWIWLDESTDAEVRKALGDYRKILSDIKGRFDSFDIAMFPVDSRIGREYWTGAEMFLNHFNVKQFVPMHFCLGENAEELRQRASDALDCPILLEKCQKSNTRYLGLMPGSKVLI